jgi:hypothetical protein
MEREKPDRDAGTTDGRHLVDDMEELGHSRNTDLEDAEKPAAPVKIPGVDCDYNCGTCGECGRKLARESNVTQAK